MTSKKLVTAVAVSLIGAMLASRAQAESNGSTDAEIALLKQQLLLMQQKLDKLQKQTSANAQAAANANAKADHVANANAAIPTKAGVIPSGVVVTMPGNRPTICTEDGLNCVAITSRLHWDVGGYNYRPNSASTSPQTLDNGENVRRARIGVVGKFLGDWNYALIYDFGGSDDGFGGAATGSLPGGGTSGVENAFLSYQGLKPFGGKLAVEGGIMDLPYTLGEATSSNDILFMERASATNVATNIAAGDFRSAVGTRWWSDTLWVGGYVTGPTSGQFHSGPTATNGSSTEQVGAVARVAGQVVSGNNYSLHLGADAEFLVQPSRTFTGVQSLTLSDRPELRIDPTSILSASIANNVSAAQVYSAEAAANYGPMFFQGEYFWYNVDRDHSATAFTSQPSVQFDGGYAEASYVLTGETHTYNAGNAAYNGVKPANPFSLSTGGWGAWEIAARFSTIDLNDQLASANGIAGGRQTIYTAGLNWYVSQNIRFMFNYLHGDISKQSSTTTNITDIGATFNAVAMRTQIAF